MDKLDFSSPAQDPTESLLRNLRIERDSGKLLPLETFYRAGFAAGQERAAQQHACGSSSAFQQTRLPFGSGLLVGITVAIAVMAVMPSARLSPVSNGNAALSASNAAPETDSDRPAQVDSEIAKEPPMRSDDSNAIASLDDFPQDDLAAPTGSLVQQFARSFFGVDMTPSVGRWRTHVDETRLDLLSEAGVFGTQDIPVSILGRSAGGRQNRSYAKRENDSSQMTMLRLRTTLTERL